MPRCKNKGKYICGQIERNSWNGCISKCCWKGCERKLCEEHIIARWNHQEGCSKKTYMVHHCRYSKANIGHFGYDMFNVEHEDELTPCGRDYRKYKIMTIVIPLSITVLVAVVCLLAFAT